MQNLLTDYICMCYWC